MQSLMCLQAHPYVACNTEDLYTKFGQSQVQTPVELHLTSYFVFDSLNEDTGNCLFKLISCISFAIINSSGPPLLPFLYFDLILLNIKFQQFLIVL